MKKSIMRMISFVLLACMLIVGMGSGQATTVYGADTDNTTKNAASATPAASENTTAQTDNAASAATTAADATDAGQADDTQAAAASSVGADKTYSDVSAEYEKNNYSAVSEDAGVELLPEQAALGAGKTADYLKKDPKGYDGYALQTTKENQYAEWNFEAPEDGLYEIDVDYMAIEGSGSKIQRSFVIDGAVPFQEANNISFYRYFVEDGKVTRNSIGDEVWPSYKEKQIWQNVAATDSKGYYSEPLQFYLSKGTHTFRMAYVDQDMTIGKIKLSAPHDLPSYKEVKEEYADKGYKDATASLKLQAEETKWKNVSTIRRESDTDPKTEPSSSTNRLLNIMGGGRWSEGNQSITWTFDVKQSGLYKISFRGNQSEVEGMPSYRQIAIDGQVPFKEMEEYAIPYKSGWSMFTLQDENKDPYQFYLTKGKHEFTMTVKVGRIQEVITDTTYEIQYLSDVVRELTKITGSSPDVNYEYHLDRTMPELSDDLKKAADGLERCENVFKDVTDVTSQMENNYRDIVTKLRSFAADTDRVIKSYSDLADMQTNLGGYLLDLAEMPLSIDYFEVAPKDAKTAIKKSNFIEKAGVTISNFLSSFTKDYDSVGSQKSKKNTQTINVWIARGTEWGEILKDLADENFTKKTGINVNVNIIPSGQLNAGSVSMLMLSINSHKAPDVALGVDYSSPAEFAFRDAVVDLTQFPDYNKVSNQFYKTMFVPYSYKGGVYALPETMDFTTLIYRKDIMQELNLPIPSTWDDLYQTTLPKLYENNMGFSFPVDSSAASNSPSSLRGLTMLLAQKQGSYYTKDGMYSALDSPAAFDAFNEWTQMYSNYGVDAQSDFFTRMRTGTMPIGVGNYATYMKFLTSAPDLYGRWAIAPMLGTLKSDGTVDRSVGGISSTASMIMKQTKHKDAAWKFLKWWMSTDTQIEFGREVEAILGTSARWNTANIQAFESLPWDANDLKIIKDQLSQAQEQPIVLGGYYTTRDLVNAWNRVVLSNENPRDAIEESVKDINKELRTQHEAYGFKYDD